MKERTQTVSITETTAFGARDRVLDDLNTLTGGEAYKAIQYVLEFLELEKICEKFKEEKEEEEEEPPLPFTPDEVHIALQRYSLK